MLLHAFVHTNGLSRQRTLLRLIFTTWVNWLVVTCIICHGVLVGIAISNHYYSKELSYVSLGIECIILVDALLRMQASSAMCLRSGWDLLDFTVSLSGLFAIVSTLLFGAIVRHTLRLLLCLRLIRVIVRCSSQKYTERITPILSQTFQVFAGTFLTLAYTGAFYTLLSMVGGLLVTADVLPSLARLRSATGGAWDQARPFFASLAHSIFSLYEILFLDGWYVDFCHPLLLTGKWFSGVIALFVVFLGSLVYANLLMGCIVDRTVLITTEMNDASKLAAENELDEKRIRIYESVRLMTSGNTTDSPDVDKEIIMRTSRSDEPIRESLHAIEMREPECKTLLDSLDGNGDGSISWDDLKAGLTRYHKDAQGQDIVRINTLSSKAEVDTGLIQSNFSRIEAIANSCLANMAQLHAVARALEIRRTETKQRMELDRVRARNRAEFRKHLEITFLSNS